jgi:hypothetical protein
VSRLLAEGLDPETWESIMSERMVTRPEPGIDLKIQFF